RSANRCSAAIRVAAFEADFAYSRELDGMSPTRHDRTVALVPAIMLASFSLFWISYTIADPDLWGHVRFGLDILRTGTIVQRDVYSYRTGSQPWINHEWLSEVLFASIYDSAGPCGLIVFKLIVGALIVGICFRHLCRYGLAPLRAAIPV